MNSNAGPSLHETVPPQRSLGQTVAGLAALAALLWSLVAVTFWGTGCAGRSQSETAPVKEARAMAAVESKWGVRPLTVRLTGADHFLDFRYRVVDPEKAKGMMGRDQKAFLIHESSGMRMPVPVTKLGPLRGSSMNPKPDRVYAVLFNNVGKKARGGDAVTVVIGRMRVEGLTVEAPPRREDRPAAQPE